MIGDEKGSSIRVDWVRQRAGGCPSELVACPLPLAANGPDQAREAADDRSDGH